MIEILSLWWVLNAQKNPITIIIGGNRSPDEAVVSKAAMRYIPFDVPQDVSSITVEAQLDHGPDASKKGIADIGLFDPRGYGIGGPGFRGWQGGAGTGFTLSGDVETTSPWYIPGPIPPGTWHLAQYFLRSSPAGLKYKYTITLSFAGSKPPRSIVPFPSADTRVLSAQKRYYAGNLHCHSIHSDGGRTLFDLMKLNRDSGFEFVVSTEHNTPSAIYEFPEAEKAGPLLLIGTELTTPGGHAGILGQRPGYWWDFRTDPGDGGLPKLIHEVKRQNALFIINHPFAMCTTCPWHFPENEWTGADGVEVWNGKWSATNELALRWWDSLLQKGEHLNAYGGTDYHRGSDPLVPATWANSDGLAAKPILEALRRGHTIVSSSARSPLFEVTIDGHLPGDTLRRSPKARLTVNLLSNDEGNVYAYDQDGLVEFRLDPKGECDLDLRKMKYIRFELRRTGPDSAMLSLTNAFFVH